MLTGLHEGGIGERTRARICFVESSFASRAYCQIDPPEMTRPFIFLAQGNRGDPHCFELLNQLQEFAPGRWELSDPCFAEDRLIVPEANCPHIPGDAIIFAIRAIDIQSTLVERIAPRSEERRVGKECRSRW